MVKGVHLGCSDCEVYGLKKHGLTRSDCIKFLSGVAVPFLCRSQFSRLRLDESNTKRHPNTSIYNYLRLLNTWCNIRCEIHVFPEKVRI